MGVYLRHAVGALPAPRLVALRYGLAGWFFNSTRLGLLGEWRKYRVIAPRDPSPPSDPRYRLESAGRLKSMHAGSGRCRESPSFVELFALAKLPNAQCQFLRYYNKETSSETRHSL